MACRDRNSIVLPPESSAHNSMRTASRVRTQSSSLSVDSPNQRQLPLVSLTSSISAHSARSDTSTLSSSIHGVSQVSLAYSSAFASDPSSYSLDRDNGPLQPVLPLPSPSVPTPSFLTPQRTRSTFPFLPSFLRRSRRHKKLVISRIPYFPNLLMQQPEFDSKSKIADLMLVRQKALDPEDELQMKGYNAIVKWCESFGVLKNVEARVDGSLHIYWKEWEVADTVCRIQGDVFLKDIGTVSLAWYYVN